MTERIDLTMLKASERGIVRGFAPGDAHYRRRLMAMGLTPGTTFTVTRLAPLGDPVQIAVRDSALTLRKDEAMMLRIDRLVSLEGDSAPALRGGEPLP